MMQERLADFFHKRPYAPVNPQDAVALGAAYRARQLFECGDFSEAPFAPAEDARQDTRVENPSSVQVTRFVCQELVPHTIGVVVSGGEVLHAIRKGQLLPVSGTVSGVIALDADDIRIPLVQGDSTDPSQVDPIGTAVICNAPCPELQTDEYGWDLTIRLDCSGCLSVSAAMYVAYMEGAKCSKEVRVEASPPASQVTSEDPRVALDALVRQIEIMIDQLQASSTFVDSSPTLWRAVSRRIDEEKYRIERGVVWSKSGDRRPIEMGDVSAARQWFWDNLKAPLRRARRRPPSWLLGV
jgi:molecular chaperone DnaK (HSP70)